jgi:hypothetical protein
MHFAFLLDIHVVDQGELLEPNINDLESGQLAPR